MRRHFWAVALASALGVLPSSGFLWEFFSTLWPTSQSLKEGPGLDPNGAMVDEGPGLDPSGATAPAPRTEAGPELDPNGRS